MSDRDTFRAEQQADCNCDLARSEPLDHRPGEHHQETCPRFMLGGSDAQRLPATYPVDGEIWMDTPDDFPGYNTEWEVVEVEVVDGE